MNKLEYNTIIIAVLVLLSFTGGFSQNDKSNLEKYFLYRNRLKNEFLVVGSDLGESIPAEKIHPNKDLNDVWGKTMYQSDGTSHLGWYIAVMATEYALLQKNGYNTSLVEEELFFALNSVWRLDAHSEFYDYPVLKADYNPSCYQLAANHPANQMTDSTYNDDGILNGFLIRSDGPWGFETHFTGIDQFSSDLTAPNSNQCRNKEMSQDQAIFLLMGLYAVKELVPTWVAYNGVPLNEFATEEGIRIVAALRGDDNWKLENPHTGEEVHRGASGAFFGWPKAQMGGRLTGNATAFHNQKSIAERGGWNAQQYPKIIPKPNRHMNMAMAGAMEAITGSWTFCIPALTSPQLMYFFCQFPGPGTTLAGLNRYAGENHSRQIYYLYHSVLYGYQKNHSNATASRYRTLLNTAPCEGPYGIEPGDGTTVAPAAHYGWTTVNRFMGSRYSELTFQGQEFEIDKFETGDWYSDGEIYNGLDYMLLHNLYWLQYDGSASDPEVHWENLNDAMIDHDWPWTHYASAGLAHPLKITEIGSRHEQAAVRAIHTLTSSSKLTAVPGVYAHDDNANVIYRAGESIELVDGFEVAPGAEFEAYIEPFECVNGALNRQPAPAISIAYWDSLAVADSLAEAAELDSLIASAVIVWDSLPDSLQIYRPEEMAKALLHRQMESPGADAPLLKALPNPTAGALHIQVYFPAATDYRLRITDPAGQVLHTSPAGEAEAGTLQQFDLDLSRFASGMYYLIVDYQDGLLTEKLILQR